MPDYDWSVGRDGGGVVDWYGGTGPMVGNDHWAFLSGIPLSNP